MCIVSVGTCDRCKKEVNDTPGLRYADRKGRFEYCQSCLNATRLGYHTCLSPSGLDTGKTTWLEDVLDFDFSREERGRVHEDFCLGLEDFYLGLAKDDWHKLKNIDCNKCSPHTLKTIGCQCSKSVCTCDITTLMSVGCKCGHLEKEKSPAALNVAQWMQLDAQWVKLDETQYGVDLAQEANEANKMSELMSGIQLIDEEFKMYKAEDLQPVITIDGHGGHLCEAGYKGICEVGETIEEAIGRLVLLNPQEFGVIVKIEPCDTTAYKRSKINAQVWSWLDETWRIP